MKYVTQFVPLVTIFIMMIIIIMFYLYSTFQNPRTHFIKLIDNMNTNTNIYIKQIKQVFGYKLYPLILFEKKFRLTDCSENILMRIIFASIMLHKTLFIYLLLEKKNMLLPDEVSQLK